MDIRSRLIQAVYNGIDMYNMDIPDADHVDKTTKTILFDVDGKLDSVGFVALSTAIEQSILKEFGQPVALFTQETFARADKPLRTVSSLINYIGSQLKGSLNQ